MFYAIRYLDFRYPLIILCIVGRYLEILRYIICWRKIQFAVMRLNVAAGKLSGGSDARRGVQTLQGNRSLTPTMFIYLHNVYEMNGYNFINCNK